MEQLPRSKADPVALVFAMESIPNKSVHFSFNQKDGKKINVRIPATQLSGLIESLLGIRDSLEESGLETGRGSILIPAAPYGFFENTDDKNPAV